MSLEILETISAAVIVVVVLLLALKASYTVVPPNEAHVVVTRSKGRKVYCTRDVQGYAGSAYWRIPIIQKVSIIPLENLQIKLEDIPLRDQNMAKFNGDVVAWLNITQPLTAAERISGKVNITEVNSDVSNVIQAVTRNESMYNTIIDILKNRKDFSERVEKAVNAELTEWGMRVIELEVIHFTDAPGYTVISDLEKRQATIINVETRKTVASQNKEAIMVESTSAKEADVLKATNENLSRQAQIATQEAIAVRDQAKQIAVAEKTKEANLKTVEATKAMQVGTAQYEKDVAITQAEGKAEATFKAGEAAARIDRTKGEYNAKVTQAVGEAEANIIFVKGKADADATNLRADALKKYNEAGIGLEVIKSVTTIQIKRADAWAEAMSKAQIKVYSGADNGMLNPATGFGAGSLSEVAKDMGFDVSKILENLGKNALPVANVNDIAEKAVAATQTTAPKHTKTNTPPQEKYQPDDSDPGV